MNSASPHQKSDDRFRSQAKWTRKFQQRILSLLPSHPASILEVGSGTGAFLSSLAADSNVQHQFFSADIDLERLIYAQTAAEMPATQCDGNDLPYHTNQFDLAICHYLLMWIADPVAVLREMLRVTKAGGWVIAAAEPDYEARIDYPEGFIQPGKLQSSALRNLGADTKAGRKLPAWFASAGMKDPLFGIHSAEFQGDAYRNFLKQELTQQQKDIGFAAALSPADGQVFFVPTFYAMAQKQAHHGI